MQAVRAGYAGRIELRPYLDWIKTLPCDTCGAPPPCDPSHVNSFKGQGTKSPDPFAIPQCRGCHENYERSAPEADLRVYRAAFYMLRAIWEGRLVWTNDDPGRKPNAEDKANAALIAAAPDLLAALEECVQRFDHDDTWLQDVPTLDKARAAIKKATT